MKHRTHLLLVLAMSLPACVDEGEGDELSPDAGVASVVSAEDAKCELRVQDGRNILFLQGTYEVSMDVGQYLQVWPVPYLNVTGGPVESIYYYCPGWSAVAAWYTDVGYLGYLAACRRDAGQPATNTVVWEYTQELTAPAEGNVVIETAYVTTTPYLNDSNVVNRVSQSVDCVQL